jgi:hypothetical protein
MVGKLSIKLMINIYKENNNKLWSLIKLYQVNCNTMIMFEEWNKRKGINKTKLSSN